MAKGVQGRYFGSPSFLFLVPEDFPMSVYPPLVEEQMRSFYESLSEKDRRRYAAVEAAKLGRGGITYLSEMLGCKRHTITQGLRDLQDPDALTQTRIRRKGGGRKPSEETIPGLEGVFCKCWRIIRRALPRRRR